MSPFGPFYAASNGVSLSALRKMGAINNMLIALALYPAGVLSDKKHPLNVNLWGSIAMLIVTPLQFIFLLRGHLHGWAPILFFVICGLGSVTQAIYAASELPMYMKILPQDRYGQFCSANSMVRAIILMIGGALAGLFLDSMRRFDHNPTDHYQFIPIWNLFFMAGCTFFLVLLRREWKKRAQNDECRVQNEEAAGPFALTQHDAAETLAGFDPSSGGTSG